MRTKVLYLMLFACYSISSQAQVNVDSSSTKMINCVITLDDASVTVSQEVKETYSKKKVGTDMVINTDNTGRKTVLPGPKVDWMPHGYQNADTVWNKVKTDKIDKINGLQYERSYYYMKYTVVDYASFDEKRNVVFQTLIDQGYHIRETIKVVTAKGVYHPRPSELKNNFDTYLEEGICRIAHELELTGDTCTLDFPVVYYVEEKME